MRATGSRRLATRLGLAVALLFASLAVLVRLASAHHPELTASASCGANGPVVRWTAVAWQTSSTDHRVNHDIRVQALVGGTWQQIAAGSFGAANNYQFTGTYDLPASVTGSLTLKVISIVNWGNAENYGSGGEYRQTSVSIPSSCGGGPGGQACGGTLGAATDYNLFIRGNVTLAASDIGGRVAAGGDASFSSYSIGTDLTPSSARVDLAVDGTLTGAGGVQVSSGSVTYGNQLVGTVSAPRGVITAGSAPFVAETFASLYSSAASWAGVAANGQIAWSTGTPRTLTLTGTDPALIVWTLSAADLQTARQIRIQAPTTASLLVNVTGTGYDANQAGLTSISLWNGAGFAQYGYPSSDPIAVAYRTHLLWNFATATNLQIGPALAWEGSILAPYAAVKLPGGAINGTVIAASASTGTSAVATELHHYAANPPCLPATTTTSSTTPTSAGPSTLPAPPTTLSPYCITYGELSGTVYEDHNANGVRDAGGPAAAVDRGVPGVTVRAFDDDGTVVGETTSGTNGAWHLSIVSSSSRDVRVEFSGLPAGYLPGSITTTGGAVQFMSLCDQDVDFAVQIPSHYCQDNPDLATTCQRFGTSTKPVVMTQKYGSGFNAATSDYAPSKAAEYDTGYADGTGTNTGHPVATTAAEIGSVSGLAWRPSTRTLYTSAYVKTGAVLGAGGASAVYAIPVAADGAGNAPSLAFTLPAAAGGAPALAADGTPASFDAAGHYGLGGMTLVSDGNDPANDAIYVVGLANRTLYRISNLDATTKTVTAIPTPLDVPGAAQGCATVDVVPFALTTWNGVVYLGLTCTAESTQEADTVRAYVYSYTPAAGWSTVPRLELPLTYDRGEFDYWGGTHRPAQFWRPWSSDPYAYSNQALLTDLTITEGTGANPGDMVIGLRTRTGDRRIDETSEGDLLKAPRSGSGWVPEAGLSPATHSEYFLHDGFPFSVPDTEPAGGQGHLESARGAVVAVPGFTTIATTQLTNWWTNGIAWHTLSTGRIARALSLFSNQDGSTDTFGKTNALGDLVALCDQAPIEVGDRVWADANDNGLQDVGEFGLPDVTVELRATNGTLVATTTTDGLGQYHFRGLKPHTAYQVRVALDQPVLVAKSYHDAKVAQGPSRSLDNDAAPNGAIVAASFTTGAPGENNHDVDIGLAGPPADRPKCACATTTTTIVEEVGPPPPVKPTYVSP